MGHHGEARGSAGGLRFGDDRSEQTRTETLPAPRRQEHDIDDPPGLGALVEDNAADRLPIALEDLAAGPRPICSPARLPSRELLADERLGQNGIETPQALKRVAGVAKQGEEEGRIVRSLGPAGERRPHGQVPRAAASAAITGPATASAMAWTAAAPARFGSAAAPTGSAGLLAWCRATTCIRATASAPAASGDTAVAPSSYVLVTHLPSAATGYAATQDVYDPATGAQTGTNDLRRDGSLAYASTVATNDDGTTSYTYSSGNYFDSKPFYAFTDTYDPGGRMVTHQEFNNDGTTTIDVRAGHQTVASQYRDTFNAEGQPGTTFVFTPGYGQDVVNGFLARGSDHDILSLPSADFASLADVLAHTQTTSAGALITDPTSGDTIEIAGVSKAALVANRHTDFQLTG